MFTTITNDFVDVPINILEEPLELLSQLLNEQTKVGALHRAEIKGYDYVILPLYSTRGGKHVPERSGLNQWNARGRKRDANEVYISIPSSIHLQYPEFFPSRDVPFELRLPDGSSLSAKVCQSNEKALMSNPNSALGEWLLRKVLCKQEGELVTLEDLDARGIDCVKVISTHEMNENGERIYKIIFSDTDYEDYSTFID